MRGLIIFDGLNILRRVYAAVPGDDTPERAEGAIKSSMGTFVRALKAHECTHGIVAVDHGGVTWRHKIYRDYKKDRTPMPAPLRNALPKWREMLMRRLGLTSVAIPYVEADDVIATCVSHWTAGRADPCYVVSTDKDMLTLSSDQVRIYDVFADEYRGRQWCLDHLLVEPYKVRDMLALMGDRSDGIPGVPQIGPKTAARLLAEHGSLSRVLAAAPTMTGAVGAQLAKGHDIAQISYQLAEVRTDVHIGVTWPQLRIRVDQRAAA